MDLALVLTHACNLRCSYCYTGEKKRVCMSEEVAMKALHFAFARCPEHESLELGFFGGEPMLEIALLERVARRARDLAENRGLRMQMTTNGTLLDRERLARLDSLGVRIALSLDGTERQHRARTFAGSGVSSYPAARRALDRLLDAGRPFDVISVVHPDNVDGLSEGVRELFDLGVRSLTLNLHFGARWSPAALEALEREYAWVAAIYLAWQRRGRDLRLDPLSGAVRAARGEAAPARCDAGRRRLAIAPSGRIYGCARAVGEDDGRGAIGDLDRGVVDTPASSVCACASREETGAIDGRGPVAARHQRLIERLASRLAEELTRDATLTMASA